MSTTPLTLSFAGQQPPLALPQVPGTRGPVGVDMRGPEAANGNGPVDAIYQAINRVTDYNIELVKYGLSAKGHGKDALGQVDIVVDYNGRRFHGVGLATDIVESSAKAMVHVLNNIWRAAEVEKELQRKAQNKENNKETV